MSEVKVIIADENEISAEGLHSILKGDVNISVLGVAKSFDELIQIGSTDKPNVIVMDFSGENFGTEKVQLIKGVFPKSKIIAITPQLHKSQILKVLKTGVSSYLLKDCSKDEIVDAVHETNRNKAFYCEKVLGLISQTGQGDLLCDEVALSVREIEIIKLIAQGLTNKEIADNLFLSVHTVNTHRKNIMQKLGLKNTASIVIYAVKENIVSA